MATVKEKKIIYDNKEHLKELVKELVTLHKTDGYENFEEISMFIREKNTKLDTFQYSLPLDSTCTGGFFMGYVLREPWII